MSMKLLEFTGKNVDEALKNALAELKVTKDRIEYEVLEQGSKGFFNLIGTKPAKISEKMNEEIIDLRIFKIIFLLLYIHSL